MNKIRVFLAWQANLSKGVNFANTALGAYNTITQESEKSGNRLEDLAHTAVYGNSNADPIGRFMTDVSGASVDNARDTIGNATDTLNKAETSVNASSTQDILDAWNNAEMGLPDKLDYIETTKGLGWKTALSTALGAPWLDFDNSDFGIKLDTDNLQASAQGAQNGSSFGPWGTLFGGIAGGLFNLGSRFGRNSRADKMNYAIRDYNNAIDNLIKRRRTAAQTANVNYQQNNFRNMFATRAAYGGPLSFTGDFSNGMTYFGTGGTHEQNEYGGIQQGVAPDGNPNLVEEGEWKWDDANYIFSNRIKIPKSIQEKYKLKDDLTFADAAGKLSKESEERPNDPISQNGLTAFMSDLAMAQEEIKAKRARTKLNKDYTNIVNSFPYGGSLTLQDLDNLRLQDSITGEEYNIMKSILSNDDYTPLDNRQQEILQMWDPDGYQDYLNKQALMGQIIDNQTPKAAPAATYKFDRPLSYNEMEDLLHTDPDKYEAYLDWMNNPSAPPTQPKAKARNFNWDAVGDAASVAPIIGTGIQTLTDMLGITNTSDYTHANEILNIADSLKDITYYNPGYRFMEFNPLSLQLLGNEQKSLNLAALDNARQLAGPNRASRAAHTLAAQYAGAKALSNALVEGYKANREQERKVAEFNDNILANIDRGINSTRQFNSELATRRATIRESAAKLMQDIDEAMAKNRSTNRDAFLNNLGTWGRERQNRRVIDENPWLLWDSSMNFKGR